MAEARKLSLTRWIFFLAVITSWQFFTQATSRFQQTTNFSKINDSQIIRIDLIHRDHPLSPIAPTEGMTFSERLHAAAKRSQKRSAFISRGRRLADFTTPITSVSLEYVITILFGTPPQQFIGMVDTGSDLVWIQCAPCIKCYTTPNPAFDPTISSSEAYVPCSDSTLCIPSNFGNYRPTCQLNSNYCQIKYSYMSGSQIEGVLTTETLSLINTVGTNPVADNFVIGCMNNNRGDFPNMDGIIGFGRGRLSLPSQFSTRGDLNVFAVCLVPFTATTTLTSSLTFGFRDATNGLGLVYTPLLRRPADSFYWVDMVGVTVGSVDIGIPSTNDVIFDTGTVLTSFLPEIYDPIHKRIASLVSYPVKSDPFPDLNRLCFDVAGVQNPTLPKITYHFADVDATGAVVDFELGYENLYTKHGSTLFCLAIARADPKTDVNIVGNIQQANHYVEYDVALDRIGWAFKDCTVPV